MKHKFVSVGPQISNIGSEALNVIVLICWVFYLPERFTHARGQSCKYKSGKIVAEKLPLDRELLEKKFVSSNRIHSSRFASLLHTTLVFAKFCNG